MISNKYQYPTLERVDLDRGRHYIDSTGAPVPSVTTILSGTSTKDGIEQWKRRVGEKEAEMFTPIRDKAMAAIDKVAKEGNYTFIFDSGAGSFLYLEDGIPLRSPGFSSNLLINLSQNSSVKEFFLSQIYGSTTFTWRGDKFPST